MKLHAYLACFFLPLTLVYIVSGVLYLFDIKGGVKSESEYTIPLPQDWPQQKNDAEKLVIPLLQQYQLPALPSDHYPQEHLHEWYGYQQNVFLSLTPALKTQEATKSTKLTAILVVKQHDFIHQLLLIHKGFAGYLFWLMAIMLGLSLTFSLASGVVISLQLPQIKKTSLVSLAAGTLVLVVAFY